MLQIAGVVKKNKWEGIWWPIGQRRREIQNSPKIMVQFEGNYMRPFSREINVTSPLQFWDEVRRSDPDMTPATIQAVGTINGFNSTACLDEEERKANPMSGRG